MRVLVTGGAGFIGSAVCRHLIDDLGYEVVVLDKLTYAGHLASLAPVATSPRFSFERHDVTDLRAVTSIFDRYRPDAVMHLAAETHVDRSISGAGAFVTTNVMGTFTMLEAARKYMSSLTASDFRFVHISTDEVFGSLGDDGFFTEQTPYDPSSPYAATKAASDHLVTAWHRTYGLPTITANCSNNYGPYHFPEKLIPLTVINALEHKTLPVYGDGSNVRDWLYVEDCARALGLILQRGQPGRSYNVGGRSERTNMEVVQRICSLMDRLKPFERSHHDLITFVADRPGHDHRYALDPTRLEQELGWRPRETFDTGLEKTVRWYLQRPDWWKVLREQIYGGERLGIVEAFPLPSAASEPSDI